MIRRYLIWAQEGHGPWGNSDSSNKGRENTSPGSNNPWSSKNWKNNKSPLEEWLKKNIRKGKLPPSFFSGGGKGLFLLFGVVIVLWLLTGFYRVQPDEQGVVLRFGKWVRIDQPGLNYHLPAPIETVLLPSVTRINRIDIGFRSAKDGQVREFPEESLMLTGDENIIDINFTVFWRINNAEEFLFNVRAPEATVKAAAESAMREVIGQTPIAEALAEGRRSIEDRVKILLQNLLNEYKAGIEVTEVQLQRVDPPSEVIDAFRDVQRARADLERLRNDAEAYRNKIIPEARGDAERIIQEAEGYKQRVIAEAQGQASRFNAVLSSYSKAPEVTQKRMYLETLEDLLSKANKVILDKSMSGKEGVLPYLPLEGLKPKGQAPADSPSENTGDQA